MCVHTHTHRHIGILQLNHIFWGPSTIPEHPLSILSANSCQPWLNVSKGLILDISNILEKQILQAPAHGNLNHRMENTTFYPIKPHKPQIFLNPCLPKHPHSFLCFPQSAKSLLLQKCNQNYLQSGSQFLKITGPIEPFLTRPVMCPCT